MIELEPADARMLVELGFTALSYGLNGDADAIFAGVQVARPTDEAGFIGAALVHLARSEIDDAVKTLRALPPTDAARTFLAIALHRSGERAHACEILKDIINTASGTPYAKLAQALLTDYEQQQTPVLR
jgi:thioredoxin-like negative regulator of GroEL